MIKHCFPVMLLDSSEPNEVLLIDRGNPYPVDLDIFRKGLFDWSVDRDVLRAFSSERFLIFTYRKMKAKPAKKPVRIPVVL